jgi:chemotaxis protein MotB
MTMAKKKFNEPEEGGGGATWLATYADMMTILFVFFVLLFSMSTINPVQWDLLVQAFGNRARTVTAVETGDLQEDDDEHYIMVLLEEWIASWEGVDLNDLLEEPGEDGGEAAGEEIDYFDLVFQLVTHYVEEDGYSEQIIIERADNYIMIRFEDRVLFGPGRVDIGPEGSDAIIWIGGIIRTVMEFQPGIIDSIRIEGHTDSVPQTGLRFTDNWDLGSGRANAVVRKLLEAGIDPRLLSATSHADTRPRGDNDTPEGRSQNRRVELHITRAGAHDAAQPIVIDNIN